MIDTHCHINFDAYADDRADVLARAASAGVTRVINPAVDVQTSQEIIALAAQFEEMFATVGIHPNSTADFAMSLLDELAALAKAPKVVAVGEIGLDYHWDKSPKSKQFEAFEAQLNLARDLSLPVIIHNRDASSDVITILEHWAADLPASLKTRPGVMHSFSAPADIAERALNIGMYLGFTGPITYKKAEDLRKIAANVPLERILVETDGPFLTPEPYRGKRNEPALIPYILSRLASLKNMTDTETAQATTANAIRLFNLPESRR